MTAETLLAGALHREWLAQSSGEKPLVVNDAVREAVELAVAGTGGTLEVVAALPDDALSLEDLLDRVREWLPDQLDPWTARTLQRLPAEPTGRDRLQAPLPAVREIWPLAPPPAEPGDPQPGRRAARLHGLFARRRRR